jgi:hypothetical protein
LEGALKARGLPVEDLSGAYHNRDRGPGAGSDRTGNGTVVQFNSQAGSDAQRRTLDWFTRYLK